jgi:hypothetical protein
VFVRSSHNLLFGKNATLTSNVFSERKHAEKLKYMHNNPVKGGLAESPDLWRWSSFRSYRHGEPGAVKLWI